MTNGLCCIVPDSPFIVVIYNPIRKRQKAERTAIKVFLNEMGLNNELSISIKPDKSYLGTIQPIKMFKKPLSF
jgi:hypothetical protein